MSTLSYPLKIPADQTLWKGITHLSQLTTQAAQAVLDQYWTPQWIQTLGTSKLKAYKVVGEEKVQLAEKGRFMYIPSRIRRGIAEWAGRTLRSEYTRLTCFQHLKVVLQVVNVKQDLDTLVPLVFNTILLHFGVYYKYHIIRQLLRMIRRWTWKYRLDISLLDYTSLVHPKLVNFTFSYAVDDDQAIQITRKDMTIEIKMKLPKSELTFSGKDWEWVRFKVSIPQKVGDRLFFAKQAAPQKPLLRYKRLKSGLLCPMLQFSWEFVDTKLDYTFYHKKRVLAIDLGLVNLATSVICEAGLQITPPKFYKRSGAIIAKIERLYGIQSRIQKKYDRLSSHAPGQNRRSTELRRVHAKLRRKRSQEVSLLVKHVLLLTQSYGCSTIALEDLRSIAVAKGLKK